VFLKETASVAAAFGALAIVPASVLGRQGTVAPSSRITVGVIGTGNQSTIDLPAFLKNVDAQVVAVCDVNTASGGYLKEASFQRYLQARADEMRHRGEVVDLWK